MASQPPDEKKQRVSTGCLLVVAVTFGLLVYGAARLLVTPGI